MLRPSPPRDGTGKQRSKFQRDSTREASQSQDLTAREQKAKAASYTPPPRVLREEPYPDREI